MGPSAGLPDGPVEADEGGTSTETEPQGRWPAVLRSTLRLRGSKPAAVAVVALAVWLPYSFHAGFLYDDWASAAGYKFHVGLFTSYRPGFVIWEGLIVRLFQTSPFGYYLSLAVLMTALAVMAVVTLDGLGFPPLASVAVGLLTVVAPTADSLGLWWTASQMSLAMVLGLAAIAAGSKWINRSRHPGVFMGASLILLVAAILTYEAVAPIALLPLALFAFARERRRVLAWSVPGIATAAVAALFMFTRAVSPNHKTARPLSQYPSRTWALVRSGTTTFGHHLVGFFSLKDVAVAVVVAVIGTAGWRLSDRRPDVTRARWPWLAASALACLASTYIAWGSYIPADDYYLPGQFGIGNRINLLSQFFFLTAVVLVLVTIVRVTSRKTLAAAIGIVFAAGLFGLVWASYLGQTHRDQSSYLFATAQRHTVLADVKTLLPHIKDGDEILLAGYHLTASPQWVPVLSAEWDTTGALDLLYGNGTITGQPVSSSLGCSAHGLTQPALELVTRVPYDRVVVVDLSMHQVEAMRDRSGCQAILATWKVDPNPILAPATEPGKVP